MERNVFFPENAIVPGERTNDDLQHHTYASLCEPFDKHYSKRRAKASRFRSCFVCNNIWLGFFYTFADIVHRPRNFLIGFFSVLLLIAFSGTVLLSIWKVPSIFLHIGEINVGEVDIVFKSDHTINFSKINSRLKKHPEIKGVTPRWLITADVANLGKSSNICAKTATLSTRVNLLLIDSELENKLEIGHKWKHRSSGYAEAHVHQFVLDYLRLHPNNNEKITIQLSAQKFLNKSFVNKISTLNQSLKMGNILPFGLLLNLANVSLRKSLFSRVPVDVLDGITASRGKYPPTLGNILIMDYKKFIPMFFAESCLFIKTENFPLSLPTELRDFIFYAKNIKLVEHVPIVSLLFNNRYELYSMSTSDKNKELVKRSNAVVLDALGIDFEGGVYFPLDDVMEKFERFKSILTSSFAFVVFGIVVLCVILFFSLLQTISEERQFEFAMMRTLGMEKAQIITVFIAQLLSFIIPAIFLGFLFMFCSNMLLELVLAGFKGTSPRFFSIPLTPVFMAIGLGIFFPIVTGLSFILRVFGGSLRNALDVHRQVHNEVKIVMLKMNELGLSLKQFLFAMFLLFLGLIVYFLVPLSFIFNDMSIFFVLMNFLFAIMVIGLVIVMKVFEPYAELFFAWLMICCSEKRFFTIVKKNLSDHRTRNSKAYTMILLCVTSLISSSIMFSTLSLTSRQMLCIRSGADITVISNAFHIPLNEKELTPFLENLRGSVIEEYAYHSFSLDKYPHIASHLALRTILGEGVNLPVVAVTKSFLNTVFSDFIMIGSKDENYIYNQTVDGKYDVVGSLYDNLPTNINNSVETIATGLSKKLLARNVSKKLSKIIPIVLGSYINDKTGATVGSSLLFDYNYKLADAIIRTKFKVNVRSLFDRLSGFVGISSVFDGNDAGKVLISQSSFKTLLTPWDVEFSQLKDLKLSPKLITTIRQEKLFIRLSKNIDKQKRLAFVNELQAFLDRDRHIATDTLSLVENSKSVNQLIMYFFFFTAFVCICLCTLMLSIVFTANVRLNLRVFGILRALGCKKNELLRITLYEVFSIIFSAFMLGFLTGLAVGLTIGVQITSILALPFTFEVPFFLVAMMFFLSVLSGVVVSFLSLASANGENTSVVMK